LICQVEYKYIVIPTISSRLAEFWSIHLGTVNGIQISAKDLKVIEINTDLIDIISNNERGNEKFMSAYRSSVRRVSINIDRRKAINYISSFSQIEESTFDERVDRKKTITSRLVSFSDDHNGGDQVAKLVSFMDESDEHDLKKDEIPHQFHEDLVKENVDEESSIVLYQDTSSGFGDRYVAPSFHGQNSGLSSFSDDIYRKYLLLSYNVAIACYSAIFFGFSDSFFNAALDQYSYHWRQNSFDSYWFQVVQVAIIPGIVSLPIGYYCDKYKKDYVFRFGHAFLKLGSIVLIIVLIINLACSENRDMKVSEGAQSIADSWFFWLVTTYWFVGVSFLNAPVLAILNDSTPLGDRAWHVTLVCVVRIIFTIFGAICTTSLSFSRDNNDWYLSDIHILLICGLLGSSLSGNAIKYLSDDFTLPDTFSTLRGSLFNLKETEFLDRFVSTKESFHDNNSNYDIDEESNELDSPGKRYCRLSAKHIPLMLLFARIVLSLGSGFGSYYTSSYLQDDLDADFSHSSIINIFLPFLFAASMFFLTFRAMFMSRAVVLMWSYGVGILSLFTMVSFNWIFTSPSPYYVFPFIIISQISLYSPVSIEVR